MSESLLIELGTEELPTRSIDELAAALASGVSDGLSKRGIGIGAERIRVFATPRRLALHIQAVPVEQPEQNLERRGPALSAGLDASGQPSKALLGFAASCGCSVEQLHKLETDKGSWFVFRARQPGQPLATILPDILAEALKALPIPKPMRWGDHDYAFVRPLHWLVVLHGDRVIDVELLGVRSGRQSRGHRFHHPQPVHVVDADSWLDALRGAKVLADPAERQRRIEQQLAQAGAQLRKDSGRDDLTVHIDADNLLEVKNLVEWPQAICCGFDVDFLRVPQQALVQTMQQNQKFFPVFGAEKKLTEYFVGIANIESSNPAEIRKGYERVIRPRFADARFFYAEDLKKPLAANQEALKSVTYQQSLGSVWDKTIRVAELARVIANRVGADAALATHAAALSKCDLLSRMVGEFPELQGVMGRNYANAQGEPADVAQALDEFYAPRFAGDAVAAGKLGQVLAIAERLDTLAGIFAVGMKPTGNKDPFALRRAALGLARTLIEGRIDIDLPAHLAEALAQLPDSAFGTGGDKGKNGKSAAIDIGSRRGELAAELRDFIFDRLRGYYLEQGIATEAFESVRVLTPTSLTDFDARLRAVVEFAKLPESSALAAANKRIGNILRQAGVETVADVQRELLDAGAEVQLHAALETARDDAAALIAGSRYVELLQRLATLRAPVDAFFDGVMVMADDPDKRRNRLALLAGLRGLFLHVADISLLPQ
ncbi:MAG: glycine--tRNA ligase subunit beta [Tahibacter sp.]